MSDIPPKRFGVVGVVYCAPLFLVIRRSQTVTAPGAFCFPGGGIEAGESETDALIRELEEELAITSAMPIRRIWKSITHRNVDLAWWITEFDEGMKLVANPLEVAAIHWWTIDEMRQSDNLLESNRRFLDQIESGEIHL